jgi:regulator of sigma E protease
MILTILIFVIILGLLVFVHELGHFIVAKRSGMKVDEFGFGFPPRLFGLQRVEKRWRVIFGHPHDLSREKTVYSINWIPLGGFVKIVGENNEEAQDPQSFINKPFLPRFLTLVAGVIMNVVLAWVLISVGYGVGQPVAVDDPASLPQSAQFVDRRTAILEVVEDSPADKAGIEANDYIISLDGKKFERVLDLRQYVQDNKGKLFEFEIQRGSENKTVQVPSLAEPPEGTGPTGITPATVGTLKFPWPTAIMQGAETTIAQIGAIVTGLYKLIAGGQGLESLGGPVKIAQLTGQVARVGFIHLVQFTAFLSLNLAVLNILPFPALDGGRVLFLIIEKLRGKRNNQRFEQIANTVGFLILILLMLVITVRDISQTGVVNKIIG